MRWPFVMKSEYDRLVASEARAISDRDELETAYLKAQEANRLFAADQAELLKQKDTLLDAVDLLEKQSIGSTNKNQLLQREKRDLQDNLSEFREEIKKSDGIIKDQAEISHVLREDLLAACRDDSRLEQSLADRDATVVALETTLLAARELIAMLEARLSENTVLMVGMANENTCLKVELEATLGLLVKAIDEVRDNAIKAQQSVYSIREDSRYQIVMGG